MWEKKIRAKGPGPLELFPFRELLYLETWNFVHMTSMTSCIVEKKIRAMGPGPLELFPLLLLNFVSKISQELLYLET